MGAQKSIGGEITLTIDGREIRTEWGKTILEVARENGIYIPTMCYLSKVEPIASCRMCVVEVEGVEGMILSCQEKAVDGAVITTSNGSLDRERRKIMELYDVNHPLECGVCDKSGECELQNKNIEYGVAEQEFAAKDQHRPMQNWGFVSYDPSLCIMCERCVRVCNEIVGDEALQISVGGYKSTIVNVKQDEDCSECGECMAVCPVGALVSTDFKYSANAWELDKIPASCFHCSAGCQLYYDTKHISVDDPRRKIYRVTNDFEFSSLCGAGRFGFDFGKSEVGRDEESFDRAVKALERAETIRFSSLITNEEALLLKEIADKCGATLVCDDAKPFSDFLKTYSSFSGKSLYGADLDRVKRSDVVIVLGTRIKDDAPMVKYALATATKREKAQVVYMHPIEDDSISNIVTKFVKYEAGAEEGVVAMLASLLLEGKEAGEEDRIFEFIDDLDMGYISAESNVSEEELDEIRLMMWKKRRMTIVAGEDLYTHPRASNIARILAEIEKHSDFEILLVPPASNSLGVSMICDLDDECKGYTVGYNAPGDFVLSALGDGDLDMPAINRQEGTMTTLDKRVVPTNAALDYDGYELADLARAIGIEIGEVIELTERLPEDRGYESIPFDELPDYFAVDGTNHRGYRLKTVECGGDGTTIAPVADIRSYDGAVVYRCDYGRSFNPFTASTTQLGDEKGILRGSSQFASAAKISDGDRVRFEADGVLFERVFNIDTSMKGTVALNPTFDIGLSSFAISSYRFSQVKIEKIGSEHE